MLIAKEQSVASEQAESEELKPITYPDNQLETTVVNDSETTQVLQTLSPELVEAEIISLASATTVEPVSLFEQSAESQCKKDLFPKVSENFDTLKDTPKEVSESTVVEQIKFITQLDQYTIS